MAGHLLRAGHALHVWSRRAASTDSLVAMGATRCESPEEMAAACEIVCTNLTGSADVEGMAGELAPGFAAGAIHLDFSTIAPSVARRIAAMHAAQGVEFVDAPVSGGGTGARNATLAIMWGGRPELEIRLRPLFDVLGKTVVHVGESGAGQVAKACNQMVMVAAIEACAEAARLAEAAGVDFALVRQAMHDANSGSLHVVIEPVSIYTGDDQSMKTITFHVSFTSQDKTLTDADITPIMDAIVAEAANKLNLERI